jgi:hypothetical protein
MNKFKMVLLTALAAAAVGTGALAAAPSASAAPPPVPPPQDSPCRLNTSLGLMIYPHLSQITVIGSDHKNHTYLCVNGSWVEVKVKASPTRTTTFVGSLSRVLTRV